MDFLSNRSETAIRKEIRGIRDSYHHYWDLLAELLQNSRDAINRKRSRGEVGPFFIKMEIDASSNTITVLDNGVGIDRDSLHEMLAPGGGDKDGGTSSTEVGEKGVGLTYAVFSGNKFSISSKVKNLEASEGQVLSAQNWLNGHTGSTRPAFNKVDAEDIGSEMVIGLEESSQISYPLDSYTKISVGNITPVEGDTNIFTMTSHQLRALIRTRTAVGVTKQLFSEEAAREFDFYLSLKLNGKEVFEKVDASYIVPHELIKSSDSIKLEDVHRAFITKGEMAARKKFLGSKTVYSSARIEIDGWEIDVYGVMFPENKTFKQLAHTPLKLVSEPEEQSEGASLFQTGIFVGTKGMPTGMKIEPKAGGRYPAYYKRCLFFVESSNLKFDLGRKSLHYKYTRRLQAAVAQLFASFEEIAIYQDGRASPAQDGKSSTERKREIQQEWVEAKGYADLNEPAIPYLKIPNKQEAAVAAVFHELLGAKILKGYMTLKTGYGSRYDVHASCTTRNGLQLDAVIEFKHDLDSLINDLEIERKSFSEIDLLVAWDADVQRLKTAGFDLESISESEFNGVTHRVSVPVPGVSPIEVILLRTFLDNRRKGLANN